MDASRSYLYLLTFKVLDFLQEYGDIEQTLSNDEINDDLIKVCRNNEGRDLITSPALGVLL